MQEQIVQLLLAERDRLNRAIEALQGPTKRRGRPPKNPTFDYNAPNVPDWVKPKTAAPATKRKKRTFTAAQRKAFGLRMKWHGAVFDVTTGTVLGLPAPRHVARYQVRIEGEDIEVEL